MMGKIKKYLREIEITKKELAQKLYLSRPTLDMYIEMYESKKEIPKEKYQIAFNSLFNENLTKTEFIEELKELSYLLKRDSRYGTSDFSAEASDIVSEIVDSMKEDMKDNDWDDDVYIFINSFIKSYKEYEPLYYLAKYFMYLNTAKNVDEIQADEIPYFSNYHKLFSYLNLDVITYDMEDYRAFLDECESNRSEREFKRNEKASKIQELINTKLLEFENKGIELTEAEIVELVRKELLSELKENK